jgi:hypothetical protein
MGIAAQLATRQLDFLEVEWHDVPERQRTARLGTLFRRLSQRLLDLTVMVPHLGPANW